MVQYTMRNQGLGRLFLSENNGKAPAFLRNCFALKTFLLPCLTLIPLIIILIEGGMEKNFSSQPQTKSSRENTKREENDMKFIS